MSSKQDRVYVNPDAPVKFAVLRFGDEIGRYDKLSDACHNQVCSADQVVGITADGREVLIHR